MSDHETALNSLLVKCDRVNAEFSREAGLVTVMERAIQHMKAARLQSYQAICAALEGPYVPPAHEPVEQMAQRFAPTPGHRAVEQAVGQSFGRAH